MKTASMTQISVIPFALNQKEIGTRHVHVLLYEFLKPFVMMMSSDAAVDVKQI
jgi:hypothetical protein